MTSLGSRKAGFALVAATLILACEGRQPYFHGDTHRRVARGSHFWLTTFANVSCASDCFATGERYSFSTTPELSCEAQETIDPAEKDSYYRHECIALDSGTAIAKASGNGESHATEIDVVELETLRCDDSPLHPGQTTIYLSADPALDVETVPFDVYAVSNNPAVRDVNDLSTETLEVEVQTGATGPVELQIYTRKTNKLLATCLFEIAPPR